MEEEILDNAFRDIHFISLVKHVWGHVEIDPSMNNDEDIKFLIEDYLSDIMPYIVRDLNLNLNALLVKNDNTIPRLLDKYSDYYLESVKIHLGYIRNGGLTFD